PKMDQLLEGPTQLKGTRKGKLEFNSQKLEQYEAHTWHVTEAPKGFDVLADSDYGIEIIKKRDIFATQFHPEKGGTLDLSYLISSIV
ncbi:MAG TPA: hypothetical protein VLE69_01380, partial [Candidatus Saccharimonadales bacterium]|nr:hypothetical protein [Candidatus Saccharimonadales bacterium]